MRQVVFVAAVIGGVLAQLLAGSPADHTSILSYLTPDQLSSTVTRAAAPLSARQPGSLISPSVDAFIRQTLALWQVQGIQVAVVRRRVDGSFEVDTRAYGVRDRDQAPMKTDTLLPIASNSKAFTAAAVGLLTANKSSRFSWDTKLRHVLPDFHLWGPLAYKEATVVDFLSHQSGLPFHTYALVKGLDASLKKLRSARPSAAFRSVWQYTNDGYNLASTLVSRVSHQPFFSFVTRNIFNAVGLTNTGYFRRELLRIGKISEGFWTYGETLTSPGIRYATEAYEYIDLTLPGAGAILSNAEDVSLWLQTLLSDGRSPKTGRQVIPPEVLDKLSSNITNPSPFVPPLPEFGPLTYGMGFQTSTYQGHTYIEHGGALFGFYSQITRFPDDGLGIAVLTNENSVYTHEIIKWRIAEDILGLPLVVDWTARYQAAKYYQLLLAASDEAAQIPSPPGATAPSAPYLALATTFIHLAYGALSFSLAPGSSSNTTLVSHTDNWAGYSGTLSLSHYAGNVFNATLTVNIPVLGQRDPAPMKFGGYEAEFAVSPTGKVQGLAIYGDFWGAGYGVPRLVGKTPRERAEVWFEKNDH